MQNASNIHYEDDRALFSSDEKFANFRAVSAGSIAEGALCRSASSCDNQHNRAPYSDTFMGQAGVNTVIDLADNDEKIAGYMQSDDFNSPNFKALYEKGNVVPLALNTAYYSDEFKQKIVSGFTAMALNGENQAEYKELLSIPENQSAAAVLLVGKAASPEDNPDALSSATTRNDFDDTVTVIE